jgi:hypothetical protein
MLRSRVLICALLGCALLGAGALGDVPPAFASHQQITFFEAPAELLNAKSRPQTIAQMRSLGVKAIRVELTWHSVAPGANGRTKPSFEATNPAAYDWGEYDAVLAEAKRLKWQVLLTVSSPVPRWATSDRREPYVTRPDDRDFEEFMTAVARRYRSEVSLFAIWNEPNQPAFLRPQFGSKGAAEAPRVYRGLFQAGYAGLRAGGLANPKVLMGEVQPTAKFFTDPKQGLLYDAVSPLAFLRDSLCLNTHWRRALTCGSLPAYGFSVHPYTLAAGPFYAPPNPEDVTIGTLGRLVQALGKAAKAGAIRAGANLYLTEFGIRSRPEKAIGVPVSTQAEWDAISERLAWENPRVASFSQYLLRDDALGRGPQTGLEYVNGRKKPLYYGFPVPLTVTSTRGGYNLWGLVRPATKSTTVTVLVLRPHSQRWRVLRNVRTGASGYWSLRSSVKGALWHARWTSPTGVRYEGPPVKAYPAR